MSGRTNEADVQPGYMTEAVNYPGMLVTIVATAGDPPRYALCDGEMPDGYTFNTTKNPVTGVAETNVVRGVVALIEGQEVEYVLLATNIAIAVGDLLEAAANGTVDGNSGAGAIVGKALVAKSQNDGATPAKMYIRARVTKYVKGS